MDANTIINGLLLGGFYAIVALGLSLVFGVLRIVNLAHGELVVGGAFLALLFSDHLGVGPLLALPLVAVVCGGAGYGLQRALLTRLLSHGPEGALVATFGLSLLLQGVFTAAFSSDTQSLRASYSTSGVSVLGVETRTVYLLAFAISAGLYAVTHIVLTRSRAGAIVRAAAADPATAGVMGINVARVYALTFGGAAAVAAASGVLVGLVFSFTPTTGASYLLTGMAVVVLGGVGSVMGTFVGGLVLGLVQAVGVQALGGGYRDLVVYMLFFVVLAVRPAGLLGTRSA